MTGNEKPRLQGGVSQTNGVSKISLSARKVPPFNLDAEQSLLGALLTTPVFILTASEVVNASDFYWDRHRRLFQTLIDMSAKGEPIDFQTVSDRLNLARKERAELVTLATICPVASNWKAYAETVKEFSIRRVVIAAAQEKIRLARGGEPIPELCKVSEPEAGYTLAQLMAADFPDPAWLVEGLLPEVGLTVLAGSPKVGKSWFVLDLAARLAGAGATTFLDCRIPAPGRVLYLALEDNWRRLKSRGIRLLQGGLAPDKLHLEIGWPRLDDGGEEKLRSWMTKQPDTRLVIVDVFVRIRQRSQGGNMYDEDYAALGSLKTIADEYGIAVLAVHHTNQKKEINDWMELVSGSSGLTGTADAVMLLSKGGEGRAAGRLRCTGRDLAEVDFALSFDNFLWARLDGNAEDHLRSLPRQKIIECLRKSSKAIGPKVVAEKTGQDYEAVKKLMQKMAKAGEINKQDYGKYLTPAVLDPSNPSVPSDKEEEGLNRGIGNGGNGGNKESGEPLTQEGAAA